MSETCEICHGTLGQKFRGQATNLGVCTRATCKSEYKRRYYASHKELHRNAMRKWLSKPKNKALASATHHEWYLANVAARVAAGLSKEKSHDPASI